MQEMPGQSLDGEDLLEGSKATHSRSLAGESRGQRSRGGLQPMGLPRVGHKRATERAQ